MTMTERRFAPGEIIYREGERSDFAYFIKSGRVEILKSEPDGPRQVTILGEGDVFGEMGVVLDQRRSVTARAVDDVELRAISRSGFLHAVNQQPELARSALRSLLMRLHQEERPTARVMALPEKPKTAEKPGVVPRGERATLGGVTGLRLLPGSEHLDTLMTKKGLHIDNLPFRVGRKSIKGEKVPTEGNDLEFDDDKPFNLSRRHFTIEQTRRGLLVRDCGSHLGTLVNGVRIGATAGINIAILQAGENVIVAGGDHSPYRFLLQVPGA